MEVGMIPSEVGLEPARESPPVMGSTAYDEIKAGPPGVLGFQPTAYRNFPPGSTAMTLARVLASRVNGESSMGSNFPFFGSTESIATTSGGFVLQSSKVWQGAAT